MMLFSPPEVIAFTGTREGMTEAQKKSFSAWLSDKNIDSFHHGDCIGADADAHELVRSHDSEIPIIVHPPVIKTNRAFCRGDRYTLEKAYLDRNKDLAKACSVLIATPKEESEVSRGGTWHTVRQARRLKREVYIIWPDGNITSE